MHLVSNWINKESRWLTQGQSWNLNGLINPPKLMNNLSIIASIEKSLSSDTFIFTRPIFNSLVSKDNGQMACCEKKSMNEWKYAVCTYVQVNSAEMTPHIFFHFFCSWPIFFVCKFWSSIQLDFLLFSLPFQISKRMHQEWPCVVGVAQGRGLSPYVGGAECLACQLNCAKLGKGFFGVYVAM